VNKSSYASRFRSPVAAEEYEKTVYSPDSYSTFIWQLQIPVLQGILRSIRDDSEQKKLLDFACGTGRILSFVENEVDQSDGVDVSNFMTDIARAKCNKSNIFLGNLLEQPDLVNEDYDIVTCFRFLLNAEPETRIIVLKELRKRLLVKDGILVANIHGNKFSSRAISLFIRRIVHQEYHEQLSRREIRQMFHAGGFEIIEEIGFGVMPPMAYRTPLRKFAEAIDKMCAQVPFFKLISIDLLYVCKPRSPFDNLPVE
jgi:SAM-dependent methyltransferase